MPKIKLIADSGSTKTEWCLLKNNKPKIFYAQGMSPYFVDGPGMETILREEVLPNTRKLSIDEIHFYGTGCKSLDNRRIVRKALKKVFASRVIQVDNDLTGAARSLCGHEKGVACILGTGSNSCYFNGEKIVSNSPGLGYVLGDEGSGAFLGKMVIQHYLYHIFDEELRAKFDAKFLTTVSGILESVYKKPLPNRYLAGFAIFLAENRGHYMIENILEDGLNSFFFTHLLRYKESAKFPVHFTGGIAFGFKDVVLKLCNRYEFEVGNIYKSPMEGLVHYHKDT